jgi:hypothetical protein
LPLTAKDPLGLAVAPRSDDLLLSLTFEATLRKDGSEPALCTKIRDEAGERLEEVSALEGVLD